MHAGQEYDVPDDYGRRLVEGGIATADGASGPTGYAAGTADDKPAERPASPPPPPGSNRTLDNADVATASRTQNAGPVEPPHTGKVGGDLTVEQVARGERPVEVQAGVTVTPQTVYPAGSPLSATGATAAAAPAEQRAAAVDPHGGPPLPPGTSPGPLAPTPAAPPDAKAADADDTPAAKGGPRGNPKAKK
jgi:hypothetical protein